MTEHATRSGPGSAADPAWKKSSASGNADGECVETAMAGDKIMVRDSKNPTARPLVFSRDEWKAFLDRLQNSQ